MRAPILTRPFAVSIGSALAALTFAGGAAAQVTPTYTAPKSYALAGPVRRVHRVDLDGDGRPDLVGLSEGATGPTITVLLANAAGGFAPLAPIAAGTGNGIPTSAASDFDGDGKIDVVVANCGIYGTAPFSGEVLLGNGAGGFAPAGAFPMKAYTRWLVPFDANQDGKLDLVGLNQVTHSASIYLGNGAGGFTDGAKLAAGSQPIGAAAGDADGDGLVDLVIANYASNDVMSYRATGSGNFAAPITVAAGPSPGPALLTDIDGDARLDLAVAYYGNNGVRDYLGNGSGGFAFAAEALIDSNPQALESADFDGDGRPDLVVACGISNRVRLVLTGPGGSLAAMPGVSSGQFPIDVAAGDLDGDGKSDVATANAGASSVGLLFGSGTGAFLQVPTYPTGNGPGPVRALDFDGDGKLDLVVSHLNSNDVSLVSGDGQGHFSAPAALVAAAAVDFALVNANEDGRPDLLALETYGNDLHCHPGNGAGGVGGDLVSPAGGYDLQALVAADFDGDGHLDAVVVDSGDLAHGNFFGAIRLLLGNGTGHFAFAGAQPTQAFAMSAVAGDFDNDGLPDLAVSNFGDFGYSAGIDLFLASPGVGFVPAGAIPTLNFSRAATADFDGNGKLDLVFNAGTGFAPWFGDGLGGFTAGAPIAMPGAESLRAGDLDGDGSPDLVALGYSQLSIVRNDGTGSFAPAESYTVTSATDVAVADLDADGRQDLAVAQFQPGNVAILLNATIPATGLTSYGLGTPGCAGVQGLFGNSKPQVGSPAFALYATNAPANALGLAIVTDAADVLGSDPFGLGIQLHVDLFTSVTVLPLDIRSDASGAGLAPAPIPNNPFLAGGTFHAQALWLWPFLSPCAPTLFSLSSTRGLTIVVQ